MSNKKYPNRPNVRGEHYGMWAWSGPGEFTGTVKVDSSDPDITPRGAYQGKALGFPEAAFSDLEKQGFQWRGWASVAKDAPTTNWERTVRG